MDLLVLSEVKWNYLRTRKRFLISHFPRDTRVFFFQPISFSLPNNYLPRREGNVTYLSTPVLKPHTESTLYNRLAESALFRSLLGVLIVLWVRLAMMLMGVKADATVLVSNIYFAPVVERLGRNFVCYDCNDDPTVFPGVPEWSEEYFLRICRRADVTVACSESLRHRIRQGCSGKVTVIGNGVDYELFSHSVAREELPADVASMRQPIVGYTGAIKEWFDFDLVAEVARSNPEVSLVLIGPVAPPVREEARRMEERYQNVHLLGEKGYEALPLYLAPMRVCLIPFKVGPLTSVLNPNKLYEYFAAGKTVVSLKYSEDLANLEGLLYLVDEPGSFAEAVSEALLRPVEPEKVRGVAAANSWKSKAREMFELLRAGHAQESRS
ncbi:MAG: glycosyltransferase [Candidatus Eiseniibacteriota bacterium]|nr:MAG: glycosyltransferase [Candidatus Eisenbacteria bacterium]